MWECLTTQLDMWRNSVPWQMPVIAIILVMAAIVVWLEHKQNQTDGCYGTIS